MSFLQGDLHYHIRWSTTDVLDWECFRTYKSAEERARQLVAPHEDYFIEVRGELCERCCAISGRPIAAAPPRPAHSAKRNQKKANEKG